MARDEPLLAIPLVREGVACVDARPVGKRKGVEPGINGRVAIDLDAAAVNGSDRLALQEVFEVVFLLVSGEAWLVGNRGKEYGFASVVLNHLLGIASLQRSIPAIEESGHFLFGRGMASFGAGIDALGGRGEDEDSKGEGTNGLHEGSKVKEAASVRNVY